MNPDQTPQAVQGMVNSFVDDTPADDVFQPVQPQVQVQADQPQAQPQAQPQYAPPATDQPPAWASGLVQTVQSLQEQVQTLTTPPPSQQPAGWQPKSFDEIDQRIQEKADEIARQKLDAFKSEQTAAQQREEESKNQVNQIIDQSLNTLRTQGFLPPVTNPVDPNDQGLAAQKELFAYTIAMGSDDILKTAPSWKAARDNGYYFDAKENKLVRKGSQSVAAQAPIAGASPSVSATNQNAISQKDLATLSLDQLMARGMSQQ